MNNIAIWDQVFKENEWGKYPSTPVIRFIARNFYGEKNRGKIKILEVGSGVGANLWFCAREGFSVIALEGSEIAVNRMTKRFEDEGLLHTLIDTKVGDYFNTLDEIEDESIDAIIDVESLYCNSFIRTKEVIKKCFEKLKPNGVMLSLTFADKSWGFTGGECDYHAVFPEDGPMSGKGFSRYTTKDDIEKLYKLNDNKIERIEKQEYYYNQNNVIKEWIIEIKKISVKEDRI